MFNKIIMMGMALLFITGCVPKENNNGPTQAERKISKTNTDKQSSKKKDKVVFVVPRSLECLDDMAIWAADYNGYFAEEGIELSMEQAFGTTDIKMIATGQADFAYPSPNLILAAIEEGLPVKAVAANDTVNIFGMAVPEDSQIKSWQDMKGKTVALGDAAWQTIAAPTLAAAGLDPKKDVSYVVGGDARYQMVSEKKIDMLFTWISEYEQLRGQGFKFRYFDGNQVLPISANPVITGEKLIKNNPDLIRRFLRAKNKGLYFVYCNPEAAADIVLNKFPSIQISWQGALGCAIGRNKQAFGLTKEEQQKTVDRGIGLQDEKRWELIIDSALNAGIIKNKIAVSQVMTNEFTDTSWDKAEVEKDAKNYVMSSEVYKKAHPGQSK